MKKMFFCMMALFMMGTSAQAQCLTLKRQYRSDWHGETISNANKPNGNYYRLREEVKCNDLPRTERVESRELIIADPTPQGWMALYRRELVSQDYDFVVVFYDQNKKPVTTVDLCAVSNTYNCEVQDVRYDAENDFLLFNMACPSYASEIDGKGSKLFCYKVNQQKMVWSTPYLTSNDIFIFNDKYVFCTYGFTREKDYVFMIDKFTGKIYSKLPTSSDVENLELKLKDGKELLYAVDYKEYLYIYNINDTNLPTASKSSTAKSSSASKTTAKKPASKSATKKPASKKASTARKK